MKVRLAFVSEQMFNNLFGGGMQSDESGFPKYICNTLYQYNIVVSLCFLQIKFILNVFNHLMRVLKT